MKKLKNLNPFYKGYLCILAMLTLIRYAVPSVVQNVGGQNYSNASDYSVQLQPSDDDSYLYEDNTSAYDEDANIHMSFSNDDYEDVDGDGDEELMASGDSVVQAPPMAEEDDFVPTTSVMPVASNTKLLPLPVVKKFDKNKHRIFSVNGTYVDNFPDVQDMQYPSAVRWGITPMRNRSELDDHRDELVYIGSNPYIHLDEMMSNSIPYLVPRASDLLEHLGRAFADSLYAKRIPLHKFVVSSVLRTEADVKNLSRHNVNATQRSCHLFGTTFDINYNRYYTVSSPDGPRRREVRNDSLKMVLSEVLRDARMEGRCYVRYEKLQPCFHITVR